MVVLPRVAAGPPPRLPLPAPDEAEEEAAEEDEAAVGDEAGGVELAPPEPVEPNWSRGALSGIAIRPFPGDLLLSVSH
jgi:hypothetical protein